MDVYAAVAVQRLCPTVIVAAATGPVVNRNPVHMGEITELTSRSGWPGTGGDVCGALPALQIHTPIGLQRKLL